MQDTELALPWEIQKRPHLTPNPHRVSGPDKCLGEACVQANVTILSRALTVCQVCAGDEDTAGKQAEEKGLW